MRTVLKIIGVIVLLIAVAVGAFVIRTRHMARTIKANHAAITAPDLSTLQDGTYRGSYSEFLVAVTLDVTITDGRITEIKVIDQKSGPGYEALGTIDRIIDAQSPKVDAVTGATGSSMSIMIATDRALEEAAE